MHDAIYTVAGLMLVQCASPGKGGELVGVCVCVTCWMKGGGLSRSEQLVGYF